jgi:predicted DNA binding protein
VKTIAGRLKVPRATFQEHLRKAETKLMASVIPYLNLYRYRASR